MTARPRPARAPGLHVALLRGVNVGGANRLPMRDVVATFEALGCEEVRTILQSGNVVFRASPTVAATLPARGAAALARDHGLHVPVLLRSAAAWRRLVGANPFVAQGAEEGALHVAFLADRPTKARVAALDPQRSPPDAFAVVGSEIYLHCPGGVARSKLGTVWFDAALATTSTMRNWRTTCRLLEMLEA